MPARKWPGEVPAPGSSIAAGGASTRRVSDNHTHVIRGGLNDNLELRWDGVPSLADAMRLLRASRRHRALLYPTRLSQKMSRMVIW